MIYGFIGVPFLSFRFFFARLRRDMCGGPVAGRILLKEKEKRGSLKWIVYCSNSAEKYLKRYALAP